MSASLAFNFFVAKNTVSPEMQKLGDDAMKMAAKTKIASTLQQAAMFTMYSGFAGAAAEAVALVDAVAPMTGLLAALPAVAFAGATSIAALAVGFHGLGAALKGASGNAGPTADQIVQAEHRIATAQRAAVQASVDLAQARYDEMIRTRDLALQLQEANLGLQESQLGVRDAQKQLNQALQSGDALAVAHARLALREANLQVQESQNRLNDTQVEYTKNQKQSGDQAPTVQQALQRQADATYELAEAQKALAQTKAGSGAAEAAAAYARLAPAARQVVDAIKSLVPAWKQVQQATQQSLLAGVGQDIRQLGGTYLPILKTQLAGVASGWNIAFRETAGLMKTPGFVKDTNIALGNTATFARLAGQSLAPIVDGLRQFGTVGSTFLPRLGAWIRDIGVSFDRWATNARQSGKIFGWIQGGAAAAAQLGRILLNLGGAVRGIFAAGNAGPGWLNSIERGSKAFSDWTKSAQGQSQLKEFFASVRDVANSLFGIIKAVSGALVQSGPGVSTISAYFSVFGAVVKVLADNMDLIRPLLPILITGFVAYRVATVNMTVATKAWTLATKLMKLGQEGLNGAMKANMIGLIITGIMLLVGAFIALWNKSEAFRNFWKGLWADILGVVHAAVAWIGQVWEGMVFAFHHPLEALVGFVKFILEGVANVFIDVINGVIAGVNLLIKGLDYLPGVNIQPINPLDHVHLAQGGIVKATAGGTMARIGEGGRDEAVIPLPANWRNGGGPAMVQLEVVGGSGNKLEQAILYVVKNHVRVKGGKGTNSVQLALGQTR